MLEEGAVVREKLERRIGELENEVRVLWAKVRRVTSFVDLRSTPRSELGAPVTARGEGVSMSSHGSMNAIDNLAATLVDGVVNHDDMVRANDDIIPSNHTIRLPISTVKYTCSRHWRARSSTFGHGFAGGSSQSEKHTSGRRETRRELESPFLAAIDAFQISPISE